MLALRRSARALAALAAASFVAIVLLYALPLGGADGGRAARGLVAHGAWLWAAACGAAACFYAARRIPHADKRRAWLWIGTGGAAFLVGQLVWAYHEFVHGVAPPYPSLADVGHLGMYVCSILGVTALVRGQPTRRADPELVLDTILVTFTVGALAYEFFLDPLFAPGRGAAQGALGTSTLWWVGGVAVLWTVLIQMLRRTLFPLATAALVLPGVIAFAIGNLIYATVALRGGYRPGGALDLVWDAALLLIAAAAAVAPDFEAQRSRAPVAVTGLAARVVALVVGLAGMTALAAVGIARPVPERDIAILVGLGMVIIGARVLYSLGADRRYARLLEDEVAHQTRSLMSSLSATASAERSLRLVMESVPDAITVLDRHGRVLDDNLAGRQLRGGATGTAFDTLDAAGARIARENLAAAFAGELQRFEALFRRADGSEGTCAVLYAPVREGDRIAKVLALTRDITEQRLTQEQLQQAEKLAALGQLVSGVAHEINNPAAIISGFAQTLLLDDLTPEQRETIQMVYDEATRIGRITGNLLAFARAGGKDRALLDLNDIVRRTFALRSYHLSTLNITVNLELDPTEPKAWANGSEMQQLLLNLLINAEQALTTVESRRVITIRTLAHEDRVQLEVADTGPGVPKDIQSKIFDPFYTTKPEGAGTGLGLSICYGIAHEHGGRIWVESDPPRAPGAVFAIELPRDARGRQRRPSPPAPAAATPDGPLSVLLIDDEETLRRAVLRFLKRRGIQAVGVGDGADALVALRDGRFDVIVSDVRMPGMSGREFLERLRGEYPEMLNRLIFATGDTFAPDTASLLREAGVPSLVKPYEFAKLETLLREVADAAARTSP
ncbi:MAG: hybrid sensor histidine kinase/response regulator [Gemmatimonadales bacterium]